MLQDEGIEVQIRDARKGKIRDISDYDLLIVGSGLQMARWVKQAENFLKDFKDELNQKKLAIFVSSGEMSIHEAEGNPERIQEIYDKQLVEKTTKIGIKPLTLGLFGGIWDYNKMGRITRRTLSGLQVKLTKLGFKPVEEGTYDLRDMDAIRQWARDLVKKVRS